MTREESEEHRKWLGGVTCMFCDGKGCPGCCWKGWHSDWEHNLKYASERGGTRLSDPANKKIFEDDIINIGIMFFSCGMQQKDIAYEYGMSQSRISEICTIYKKKYMGGKE